MRPCEPNKPESSGYGGVVASTLLHGLFLFALMTIAPKLLPSLPPEDPISIENHSAPSSATKIGDISRHVHYGSRFVFPIRASAPRAGSQSETG